MPEISVVIPTHNPKPTIWRALKSVTSQGVDTQIIVVDDGSTARDSYAIYDQLAERGYLVVHRPQNGGIHAALNTGFDYAIGKWCIKIDDDDLFAPDCLKAMLDALAGQAEPERWFAYGDTFLPYQGQIHRPGAWSPELNRNAHTTWYAILWPRWLWDKVHYWKPDTLPIYHEDWDFVRQLEAEGMKGLYVPTTVLHYHFDPDGNSLMNRARPYIGRIHNIIHERFG